MERTHEEDIDQLENINYPYLRFFQYIFSTNEKPIDIFFGFPLQHCSKF